MNFQNILRNILLTGIVVFPVLVLAQTSADLNNITKTDSGSDTTVLESSVSSDNSGSSDSSGSGDGTIQTTSDNSGSSDSSGSGDGTVKTSDNTTTTNSREMTTTTTTNTTTTQTNTTNETNSDLEVLTKTYSDLNETTKTAEDDLRTEIKTGIDTSIIDIRSQTEIEAYQLQSAVDDTRTNIFYEIGENVKNLDEEGSFSKLETDINNAFDDIESSLEGASGVDVDLSENKRSIRNTLLRYSQEIESKKALIEEREGILLFKDTDEDGISDYDEKNIYNTDPENAYTVEGELNDLEKIEAGINPTSETGERIQYEDPRNENTAFVTDVFSVSKVELINGSDMKEVLKCQGTALPNSLVTLYIFSTPIVVTVKTDDRGEWSYTMDKELENGDHEIYVASVNNSGRLIARSNSIPFTKTAQAATLGSFGIGAESIPEGDFFRDNFILIVLGILLIAVVTTLILTGRGSKTTEFIDDIKKGV